ncbi:hypothetical protein C8F04DRAFT_1147425 [Mycena alexandri]|uniref:DUF6534 domain-containing protein n=1 Tax=Mycena alexandri TaxID=1745969 RepID=A0AAD6S3W3_9AGAR|nr:hypothetical protein C8F04DRAFT_1147425 [Mycena alexandri]
MSVPASIPKTLGALLIGGLFATLLGGMVNIQTVLYYRSYKKDPVSVKCLVRLLDNLHTGFIWAVRDKSTPSHGLTVIITVGATSFFAHRIFLLSRKNWLMPLPVLALTLVRLTSQTVSTSEMFHYRSFDLFRLHARWIFTLGLSVSSAVDILITVFSFNHVIDKLILYGLETGILGTIVAMLLWVITPQNLIFLGLHVVIGKLYASSLLVTCVHLVWNRSCLVQHFLASTLERTCNSAISKVQSFS